MQVLSGPWGLIFIMSHVFYLQWHVCVAGAPLFFSDPLVAWPRRICSQSRALPDELPLLPGSILGPVRSGINKSHVDTSAITRQRVCPQAAWPQGSAGCREMRVGWATLLLSLLLGKEVAMRRKRVVKRTFRHWHQSLWPLKVSIGADGIVLILTSLLVRATT